MAGSLCALQLARAVAGVRPAPAQVTEEVEAICAALETAGARLRAAHAGRTAADLTRDLALVTYGEYGELVSNLRYKVMEGMLSPLPPVWDILHFAHGPFQEAYGRPGVFLALTRPDAPGERDLLDRMRRMLVPARHTLVELRSELSGSLALFDHEAMLNHLMLEVIEERRIDQIQWPGRGRDAPLYELGADPAPAPAAAPPERSPPPRRLDLLTWPELEALLASRALTAVIPLGATEQHGSHLPFATDTWIADALAERFCARVPEAIILPTVAVGCSPEHLSFPGTLSLRSATLSAVLEDLLASCRRHGFFARAFVFTAHGGNYGPLVEGLEALRAACAPMKLTAFTDFDRLDRILHEQSLAHGIPAEHAGHHAGELETSIMLALRAGAVRTDRLEPGLVAPTPRPQDLFYPDLRRNAPNGTVGDPRQAAAARAEAYLEAWVDVLVASYEEARS
jgi:creatinine amidohydrolase